VFAALDRLAVLRRASEPLWEEVDALLLPVTPGHPTLAEVSADPLGVNSRLGTYTNFVNLLDMAAIAVPSSIVANDLPFGITLIGPAGSDLRLAELAQRFHHASDLTIGATGRPLPAPRPLAVAPDSDATTVRIVVVGAHLAGLPLNGQLLERGARLDAVVRTAARYRLYALPGTIPAKPGLVRVATDGAAIEAEVWRMPVEHYGSFVAAIPAPLGIGSIELADGSNAQGFLCEATATAGAEDISHHGGWRAYRASRRSATNDS
jgi:allophanate hydrolase